TSAWWAVEEDELDALVLVLVEAQIVRLQEGDPARADFLLGPPRRSLFRQLVHAIHEIVHEQSKLADAVAVNLHGRDAYLEAHLSLVVGGFHLAAHVPACNPTPQPAIQFGFVMLRLAADAGFLRGQ